MRKYFKIFDIFMLSFILAVSISGCSLKEKHQIPDEIVDMQKSYNCVADIDFKGIKAVATISKAAPGLCHVDFSEPDILKGMKVDFMGGKITINYLGIELDLSGENQIAKSVVTTIVNALENACGDKSIDVEFKDNEIIAKGKIDKGNYTVILDAFSGFLLKMSVPEEKINVEFKDFRFVN